MWSFLRILEIVNTPPVSVKICPPTQAPHGALKSPSDSVNNSPIPRLSPTSRARVITHVKVEYLKRYRPRLGEKHLPSARGNEGE